MSKSEIEEKINSLNNSIRNLERYKSAYQNMNTKINEAIDKLEIAKKHSTKTYILLDKNYKSTEATKKLKEIEIEHSKIEEIIKELRDEILEASNNKISELNSSIKSKGNEIRALREELSSLEE